MNGGKSRPVKNLKYEFWRWRIFFITWLSYGGFYLTRKSFSVAKVAMDKDPNFNISKDMMSGIDLAYLVTYAIGQFVLGTCGDRFGTRKIILTGMLCSVIVGFCMGASHIVLLLGVFFCIQGFCQSSGWPTLTKNIAYWFSQKERGRVMGWWCTNYAIGGAVASIIAAKAAEHFNDWRYAFYVPAALLFGVWILFVFLQRNRPEDVGLEPIEDYHGEKQAVLAEGEKPEEEPEGSWKTIAEVFKNRMILILGAVYFLLKPARYAILFWGPKLISEKLGTDVTASVSISICFELGGPLGVLFAGYVSDKLFQTRRMPICVISLFALSVVLIAFNPLLNLHSRWIAALLLFTIGFLLYIPDSLVSGTAAIDFGTKKGASTAAGFINGCGSVSAILGGALPGFFSQRWGWNPLFIAFGIAVGLAAILLLPRWNAMPLKTNDNDAK